MTTPLPSPSTSPPTTADWTENWAADASEQLVLVGRAPNSATSNQVDETATDGRALRLVLGANPQPSPSGGAEVETRLRYRYGTFSTRLRAASCHDQPEAGVVTGFFTFANDGSDANGNGLPDNSEIDFEWLCVEPETIYLTMWTDYRDADAAQRRVMRELNLRTGRIVRTCYFEAFGGDACQALTSDAEALPATIPAWPTYDSAARYYEYGFTWAATGVSWWVVDPASGQRLVLWDYRGPAARIPAGSAFLMTNVWHTADWPPEGRPAAVRSPTSPVSVWVDRTSYAAP